MKTTIISRQGRRRRGDLYECTECHKFLPADSFRKLDKVRCGLSPSCGDCDRKRGRKYRRKHKEQTKVRYEKWYAKNREKVLAKAKVYLQELRRRVIDGYGGECECCGEKAIQFLAIDHRNGDGKLDRAKGLVGRPMCLYLIREGFPKERYRILCHNCNMAIALYGKCPHQSKGS